jgi:hypothetical protein
VVSDAIIHNANKPNSGGTGIPDIRLERTVSFWDGPRAVLSIWADSMTSENMRGSIKKVTCTDSAFLSGTKQGFLKDASERPLRGRKGSKWRHGGGFFL